MVVDTPVNDKCYLHLKTQSDGIVDLSLATLVTGGYRGGKMKMAPLIKGEQGPF